MIRIVHIKVEGLAGRDDVFEKKIDENLAIFFGRNGSGKTSLLKLLDSALRLDSLATLKIPFVSAEIGIRAIDSKALYNLSIDTRSIPSDLLKLQAADHATAPFSVRQRLVRKLSAEAGYGWRITPDPAEKFDLIKTHRFLQTTRLSEIQVRERGADESEDLFDYAYERYLGRYWLEFNGQLQSRIRATQQRCIADILKIVLADKASTSRGRIDTDLAYSKSIAFLQRHDSKAAALNFDEFRARLELDSLFRSVISRISHVEDDIAAVLSPTTKLSELVDKLFSGPKKVSFTDQSVVVTGRHDAPIGLRSLSSGEKQLLFLLVELVRASTGSLIIDEPELSMHVDWQRDFVESAFTLNPNCQLILATHSPDIMAHVDEYHIHEMPD